MIILITITLKSRSGRDKVLILWDLQTNTSLRIVPTYECVEALVPIPLGTLFSHLNVKDVDSPHVLSAGERGNYIVICFTCI